MRKTAILSATALAASRRVVAGIALATFISATASIAQASTYDISNDFSTASNPNGVWTYGYENTLGSPLILYDQVFTAAGGVVGWRSSTVQDAGAPAVWNNPTTTTAPGCGTCSAFPPHTAFFHPGIADQYSVFRFTDPATGVFNLSAAFGAVDTGGTDVHILVNGIQIYGASINSNSASFGTLLPLTAGDTVDFVVGFGGNGFSRDSTAINASLSSTPLPAALPLFAGGLGVMGVVGWRRKRRAAAVA